MFVSPLPILDGNPGLTIQPKNVCIKVTRKINTSTFPFMSDKKNFFQLYVTSLGLRLRDLSDKSLHLTHIEFELIQGRLHI